MKTDYTDLQKRIGYEFKNESLLEKALTHRSYRYEQTCLDHDNQRLEFLGDAILGLTAADYLFHQYPDEQEGILSRLRSSITNSHALAGIARSLSIGDYLKLGHGERVSGGAERDSNLGDCLESILGAVYLDGGATPVQSIFEQLFIPWLEDTLQSPEATNPKGVLQEFTLKQWQISPEYCLLSEEGPAHDRRFVYRVMINEREYGQACAGNKRKAQSMAAQETLNQLIEEGILQQDDASLLS